MAYTRKTGGTGRSYSRSGSSGGRGSAQRYVRKSGSSGARKPASRVTKAKAAPQEVRITIVQETAPNDIARPGVSVKVHQPRKAQF